MTPPTNPSRTFSTRLSRPISNINTTTALPTGAFPNPFGNTVQFLEVDSYLDQLNHLAPPTVMVPNRFPSGSDVAANGITIELWFKAESSGSLVNLPMGPSSATATAIAPLIYIDPNGLLRAGLFDATQITLLSPAQNLIASQNANGVINVGALNSLNSPLSVVDGQWHHAALVVQPPAQPGGNSKQSLFLDGRLADTGPANGSLGLSFVASDGTTWTAGTNSTVPLGGPITPQPAVLPVPNFLPYAQGFSGCLTEVRIWNGPRMISNIQLLIDQPLGSDLAPYEQQGLVGYVGSSQLETAVQPGTYLNLTTDAPPFDPFTGVNRIPGFQNYGIFMAIPFTTVAPEIQFPAASQPYSTKITLYQADQLQISFPTDDINKDNLNGTFSLTVTGATSGLLQTIPSINTSQGQIQIFTITAPITDCYRLDLTFSSEVTVDELQFMLVPGPANTLMQLLLDIVPLQTAYTDPSYPTTSTVVPDTRYPNQNKTATLAAYWPPFTDQTAFPINSNDWAASDLQNAYLNLNAAAGSINSTFSDFFNLCADNAKVYEVSDLKSLLDSAYKQQTGNTPPPQPQTSFDSAYDQVYAFIYNANSMRKTLSEFLKEYKGWAQVAINELALANIPSGIANQIYNGQEQVQATLKGPSKGEFIANLLIGSALWGLGAVLGPLILPAAATVTATTIALGFAGSAGANVLSELLGSFLGSSSVQANLKGVNYATLEDVVNHVNTDISSAYNTLIGNLLDPQYVQTLYSNYGLLQALSNVNAQPLYYENQQIIPGPNNSLLTGTTYASWKALIPSVFTWTPNTLAGQNLTNNKVVFMVTNGLLDKLPYKSIPSALGIWAVLENDPWKAFYWMLYQVQDWQTGQGSSPSGGQFFSVCPIFYYSDSTAMGFEYAADWVIAWSLKDGNNNAIASSVQTTLFGLGNSNSPLSLADQNNPLAATGFGWYCQIAKSGVTTPIDAFMNWGEGVSSYSPQILITEYPECSNYPTDCNLYQAFAVEDNVGVMFAAVAAADTPPPALVTLEPNTFTIKVTTIGQTITVPATLTNNQQNSLQNITATITGASAFTITGAPTEIPSGQSHQMSINFTPDVFNVLLSGTLTVTASGQYGSITLTMEFSGIASEPS